MTKLLQREFEEASKLPEGKQDALGHILLEELASERRFQELREGVVQGIPAREVLAELLRR